MKKIYSILAGLIMTVNVLAQAPQKMSYQAVIRNSSDALVRSTAVGMKISILQTTASGTAVYVETQTPTTNTNGLVSIEIGGGTVVSGNFATIDWVNGPYFIKTETDPSGGTNYTITGTSQLLSVPYALYSKKSEISGRKNIDTLIVNQDYTISLQPNNPILYPTNNGPNYWLDINYTNLNRDLVTNSFTRIYRNGVFFGNANSYFSNDVLEIGWNSVTEPIGTVFTWKIFIETFDDIKYLEYSTTVQ
jgi:hypothetical protein